MGKIKTVDVSVVVPLFNEEDSAPLLYRKLSDVLTTVGVNYELIFVDDGSSDDTVDVLKSICAKDCHLKLVVFRRNFGQTPAMVAGIDHARGRTIITMDGDLQNDPLDIPKFIELIDDGFDIVVGWRHKRQDKLLTRKVPSLIANRLIGKITGVPIKDNGCSLKAYRARVIKRVPLYSEMHRFIPAMASLAGARVVEVKVRHHARQFGSSKYGLSRIYKVLMDLLTVKMLISFSARPFTWFFLVSVPFIGASILLVLLLFVFMSQGQGTYMPVTGSGLLAASLVFFLIGAGVLAELIVRYRRLPLDRLSLLTAKRKTVAIESPEA